MTSIPHDPSPVNEPPATRVCKKCGVEKPLDQFARNKACRFGYEHRCRACVIRQANEWREAHPERSHELGREFHHRHKEQEVAYRRQRPELYRAIGNKYHRSHAQQERVYANQWYKKNITWAREKGRRHSSRRRALVCAAQVAKIDYAAIIARDNYLCYLCQQPIDPAQLAYDHYIPLSRGGPHTIENLRMTHRACNGRKHDKLPEELGL